MDQKQIYSNLHLKYKAISKRGILKRRVQDTEIQIELARHLHSMCTSDFRARCTISMVLNSDKLSYIHIINLKKKLPHLQSSSCEAIGPRQNRGHRCSTPVKFMWNPFQGGCTHFKSESLTSFFRDTVSAPIEATLLIGRNQAKPTF